MARTCAYDCVKAMPNRLGNGKVWLGDDAACLKSSAKFYSESFDGFEQAITLMEVAGDAKGHELYFQCAALLARSMMAINAFNLVGFALEAQEQKWEGIPAVDEAAERLRRAIPSRHDCVVLAVELGRLFPSPAWKSRIKFNQVCALLAMICVGPAVQERQRIIADIESARKQLDAGDVAILSKLATTRHAVRSELVPSGLFDRTASR